MAGRTRELSKNFSLPLADFDYEILTEYNNVLFWSIDLNGEILYINECFCSALGYSKRELLGSSAFDLVREYNSDGVYQWNRIEEVMKNPANPPARDLELRCKNGDTLWVDLRPKLFIMPKTNKPFSICVGLDITERRKMDQNLKNIHSYLLLSVFLNNALEKNFSFSEVNQYAVALEIEIKAPIVCLVLQPRPVSFFHCEEPPSNPEWKLWATHCMQSAIDKSNTVLWDSRDGIAALVSIVPGQPLEQQLDTLVRKISEIMKKREFPRQMILGVSDIWLKPENISAPYKQASNSASLGAFLHPDEFAHRWKDLGMLKLLLDANHPLEKQFVEDNLGPLLQLHHANKVELLQTLGEILTTTSVSLMARRLHIHRKTVAYRRERLEKLLNVDLDDPVKRSDLLVALRLYQIHKQDK